MDENTRNKILSVIGKLNEENQPEAANRAYGKPLTFYWNNSIEEAVGILKNEVRK